MSGRLCASFAICHIDLSRRVKYLPVWMLLQSFTVYDQRLAVFLFSILPNLGRYICPHQSSTLLWCLFASTFATYPRETIICVTFVVMVIVIEIYCRHPHLKHFPEPARGTKLLLCSTFMMTWQRKSHTQLLRRSRFRFCVPIM